jgi:hypothetical protein
MSRRLRDIASVIRSKNAGPFEVSIDIMFEDDALYERACASPGLSKSEIARRYKIAGDHVLDVIHYRPARAIKINLLRPVSSGSVGDRDVYGAQQYVPLLDVELDMDIDDVDAD